MYDFSVCDAYLESYWAFKGHFWGDSHSPKYYIWNYYPRPQFWAILNNLKNRFEIIINSKILEQTIRKVLSFLAQLIMAVQGM
jgi:hypothetical protein